MRNKIMFMVSAGSAALILSGAAVAAPPIDFGGWALGTTPATEKTISATCVGATGTTCATAMAGDYFLQRTITVPVAGGGSQQYIQTIVTDATGFKDENFVSMGGRAGIAGLQTINQTQVNAGVTTVFTSAAELQTGWAAPSPGINRVILGQTVTQPSANFSSTFGFSQDANDAGVIQGKKLDLGQSVNIAPAGATTPAQGVDDKQLFVLRQRQGTSNPTAGNFQLEAVGPLPYAAGDQVQVVWIGQGITMGAGLGAQNFGYQSYANLSKIAATDPAPLVQFDLARMGPFDPLTGNVWNAALFGAKPSYTPPVINP